MKKMRQAKFSVGQVVRHRHYDRIGDQVVDVIGTRRCWIAEIGDLYRSRAKGQDFRPHAAGIAIEFYKDLNAVTLDLGGRRPIAEVANAVEMLECIAHALAECTAVVRAVAIGERLEPAAIMPLK